MALPCFIQLRRVELLKILLLLEVLVEASQVRSEAHNVIHFTYQDGVEVLYVWLDVTLRLFNILKDTHIFFDDVDYVIDVLSVVRNETFFFLEYHFDQVLMVAANLVNIASIFSLKIIISLQRHFSERARFLWLRPLSFLILNLLAPLRLDKFIILHRCYSGLNRYKTIICWKGLHRLSLLDLCLLLGTSAPNNFRISVDKLLLRLLSERVHLGPRLTGW